METKLHIFGGCTESLNIENSSYTHKKTGTTFDAIPTLCVSSANKGIMQLEWATIVR
jgi:hypothetical protein